MFLNQANLMLSCHKSHFNNAFSIKEPLELVGEDNFVILKMFKEFLKLLGRILKLFHQFLKHNLCQDASVVFFFLDLFIPFHIDKRIIDANKGDLLFLINSENLIEIRVFKSKLNFFAAVGVDHHNLF